MQSRQAKEIAGLRAKIGEAAQERLSCGLVSLVGYPFLRRHALSAAISYAPKMCCGPQLGLYIFGQLVYEVCDEKEGRL